MRNHRLDGISATSPIAEQHSPTNTASENALSSGMWSHAASTKQLEASTDALDQAGLNLDDLTPDVSNIDVALTDTGIDIAEFDLKGVDVGDFHVDVGGIDSGIGSIDSGLSSIDVGGGMSMGGGFDSGGF